MFRVNHFPQDFISEIHSQIESFTPKSLIYLFNGNAYLNNKYEFMTAISIINNTRKKIIQKIC